MRTIIKSILLVALVLTGLSCADEALDPLQFEKVSKGTLLALRGSQLDAIYWNGEPYGDAFYPNKLTGTDSFDFDAEFLSGDPSSLTSFDMYVIKRTKSGNTVTKERILLRNVPFSEFKTTEDYPNPWVSVSIKLTDMLAKIGVNLNSPQAVADFMDVYETGVVIESDLNLADGSKVSSVDLVAAGLYESDQFYPAQQLTYGVEDIDDARPVATTSLRGQYSVVSGKPVRTVLPLKNGAKDTLNITFDQAIDVVPSISISPIDAGALGTLVKVAGKTNQFYIPFTAGALYTGNVTFTISGATSAEGGALAGLEQEEADATIAVDNLAPQNTSFTTGTRVGKGQSATITLKFNEALGTAPTVTIDALATGIDGVVDAKTTLSSDGLTATYTYEYKDLNGDATHGDVTVSVLGGKDKAGNDVPAIAPKSLTIDIGAAPAPSVMLDGVQYDWGTQIKWTMSYATGPNNIGGSTSGTVYYVAITSGAAAPVSFVGGDVPGFVMAPDVTAKQTGTVAISSGTSGSVYSPFSPNGTLDVYLVFLSSSGVISAISAPVAVTMN